MIDHDILEPAHGIRPGLVVRFDSLSLEALIIFEKPALPTVYVAFRRIDDEHVFTPVPLVIDI